MSKGDFLTSKRDLLLRHLFEKGAITSKSAIDGDELQELLDVEDQDFDTIYKSLRQADLVKCINSWAIPGGTVFKLWLTEKGLKSISEIKMNEIEKLQNERFQFLKLLYDKDKEFYETEAKHPNTLFYTSAVDLGELLGFSSVKTMQIVNYLAAEGLVERLTHGGDIGIKHPGKKEVEDAILKPDNPTEHFPANVTQYIISAGTISNSPIQQASVNSSQTVTFGPDTIQEITEFIEALQDQLIELQLDSDDLEEIKLQINAIELQLSSKNTSPVSLQESLKTIRSVLEGVTGSLIASGLIQQINSISMMSPWG